MIAEASKPLVPVWRTVRHLLPVYAGMAQRFDLPAPPCDLSQVDQSNDQDAMLRTAEWIELVDDSSQPHHLRAALQETGNPASDLCLQIWIQHFLSKPVKTTCDRDKIDFLLVQYLCLNMPPSLQDKKLTRAEITAILEPVLGACDGELPEAIADLDVLLGIAERCQSLQEFEHNAIIPHGRELKFAAGDLYFSPAYLLAFTHFNAVVRGECLRLMNADLKFIGEGLERLEQQGVQCVDCSAAGWSDHEPLLELKKQWATWELAAGDYSTDFFTTLIGFRTAIEEALAPSVERSITAIWDEMCSIRTVLVSMQSQINELTRILNKATLGTAPATSRAPAAPANGNGHGNGHAAAAPANAGVPAPSRAYDAPANGNGNGHGNAVPLPSAVKAEHAAQPPSAVSDEPAQTPDHQGTTSPDPHHSVQQLAPEMPVVPPAEHEAPPMAPEIPVEVIVEKPVPQTIAPPPAPVADLPRTSDVPRPPSAGPDDAAPASRRAPGDVAQPPSASPPAPPPAPLPGDEQRVTGNEQRGTSTAEAQLAELAAANLNEGITRVQKILAGNGKRTAAISIAVSGTRVLLTPAEVGMFSDRESACAGTVQRAVVARLYLVSALETHSKTRDKTNLAPLVAMAKAEQESLKAAVTECKANKRTRDEEILSATGKQLAAMLERAARILK